MDTEQLYRDLRQTMAKRRGQYPAMDIPEFYALARELFTPEEAAMSNAMPRGFFTAAQVAAETEWSEDQAAALLEQMADKGLCTSALVDGTRFYGGPAFVPGIFEFQFMRGTSTDRDRVLARLIHAYKKAHDEAQGQPVLGFPTMRVISVARKVKAGNRVHTYDQVADYIEKYDPISVSTCFCRHEAKLIDEQDQCGKPNEVCMQFGFGARFVSERGMGRIISKDEARDILKMSEEAGLVHCSTNVQEGLDFLCNCCSCHCMVLKEALRHPKPGLVLTSSFQPEFDGELCVACEICIDRCPGSALTMGPADLPLMDLDRCFGCGVCATGCPEDAVAMVARTVAVPPPPDKKALKEALKAQQPA